MAYHPFRHLGLKVLAITLASVLWFTVAGEHVVERSLRVPLAVRNLPTHLEIVGDLPDSVDVRVRGSSAQLSRLDPGDVVAMLDLSSDRTGQRLFHLRSDEVRVPVWHRSRASHAADDFVIAREIGQALRAYRAGDRR